MKKILFVIFGVVAIALVAVVLIEFIGFQTYQSSSEVGKDIALYQQAKEAENEDKVLANTASTTEADSATGTKTSAKNAPMVLTADKTNSAQETKEKVKIQTEGKVQKQSQAQKASQTLVVDQISQEKENDQEKPLPPEEVDLQTMVIAGGCFWCVEADMEKAFGVKAVVSGYSGGETKNPTYENYAEGGHREVVEVVYDANQISYKALLFYFIKHIDPTDPKGSFGDRGVEYSPAIYYETQEEKQDAKEVLSTVASWDVFTKPLTVPVVPEEAFWLAEDYHQNFYKKSIIRYKGYRKASGRDDFIGAHWHGSSDEQPYRLCHAGCS